MQKPDQISILSQIQQFILTNITSKSILVVGATKSGKSSLIKFLNGSSFTRETNEQDLPYLIQNQNSQPVGELLYFNRQQIPLELTIIKVKNIDGDEIAIIQMPAFFSLLNSQQRQQQKQKSQQILLSKVFYGTFVWNIIIFSVRQIHICLVTPYQFITDDQKLIQFFSIWQQSITAQQNNKQALKKAVSIIFTKPEYEDDKQSLIQSLQHLSQAQNSGITNSNTYSFAIQQDRIFCFLSQDTEEDQGQQLCNQIMQTALFYNIQQEGVIFKSGWQEFFVGHLLKQLDGQKIQILFQALSNLYKKLLNNDQLINEIFDKDLSIIGRIILVNFINSLPKQCSSLKGKVQQLQNQIKNQLKNGVIRHTQMNSTLIKLKQNQEKNGKKPQDYLRLLLGVNTITVKSSKLEILISQSLQKINEEFWNVYGVAQSNIRNTLNNWYSYKFYLYRYISILYHICTQTPTNTNAQLQSYTHILEDINKEVTKRFSILFKNKLSAGIKKYDIFSKLAEAKNKQIIQSDEYKQLAQIFGGSKDDQIEQQQGQEQEDQVGGAADPRIRRYYYKNQSTNNGNFLTDIQQRAKKIVIKQSKVEDANINERQYLKNLLNALQRQKQVQSAYKNLQLLAKKLIQFKCMQQAMQVYMDLGDSQKLFYFLSKFYLIQVEKNRANSSSGPSIQYVKSTLIPYLQQKSTIYSDAHEAKIYRNCLQLCYDFIAVNYVDQADQYVELMNVSNEIQNPTQEQCLQLNSNLFQQNQQDNRQEKDLPLFKYISFSKAEIIQKVYKRNQVRKKNAALFIQIKKYIQAAKNQSKSK